LTRCRTAHRDARRYRGGRNGAARHAPFHGVRLADAARPRARAEGYSTRDETLILAAPVADIAEPAATRQLFRDLAPPRRAGGDLGEGGIGPARLAIMAGAGPKTSLFGRINDRPAGTAFIAVQGRTAMLHALEVASSARRQGLARLMVRAGAAWAADTAHATSPSSSQRANDAAQRLYASLGLKPVEKYHYRVK
jgi:GNAT superfamily N-acetyltransferase